MKLSEVFNGTRTAMYQQLVPKSENCLFKEHLYKGKGMALQSWVDEIMGAPIHWSCVYYSDTSDSTIIIN